MQNINNLPAAPDANRFPCMGSPVHSSAAGDSKEPMQTTVIECSRCDGSGQQSSVSENGYNICDTCGGRGKVATQAENREVFAADEIPFEVALNIVRNGMEVKLATLDGCVSEVSFIVENTFNDGILARFCAYKTSDGFSNKVLTLDEIKFKTAEEKKAAKIAELRAAREKADAELAKLESEVAS